MEYQPIGALVIVLDKTGKKVLIGKRKNSYGKGLYGMPGGRLELKELLTDTVKRELFEETGFQAKELEYIGVVRELQGEYNFIHFGFYCTTYQGKLKNKEPHKTEKWEWIDLDKIPENILPAHKTMLEVFLNKKVSFIEIVE